LTQHGTIWAREVRSPNRDKPHMELRAILAVSPDLVASMYMEADFDVLLARLRSGVSLNFASPDLVTLRAWNKWAEHAVPLTEEWVKEKHDQLVGGKAD